MKILIAGAGPAGLTLAYWLHRYGQTPIIVEKASDIRTAGYMIDLVGSGYDVVQRMNVLAPLREVSHPLTEMVYKDAHGATTVRLPTEKLYGALNVKDKYLALDRRDLVETLYHAVQHDVEIRFGTTITALCQSETEATATFTNREQETFDLIIGADGIHSKVRELVLGDESQFSHYLGYYFATFYAPVIDPDLEQGNLLVHLEPNVQFAVYAASRQHWLVYVVYRSENVGTVPPDKHLEALRHMLHNVGWIVPDILNALTADNPIFFDKVEQITMPIWSSNRVALLGDAAYCPTLISGQGASMAMAGAYFLAQALERCPSHHAAFQQYERRLRPFIESTQKKARDFAPNFVPSTPFRISLITLIMKFIDFPPLAHLIGSQMNTNSILEDEPQAVHA